jgi:hypothetical protein
VQRLRKYRLKVKIVSVTLRPAQENPQAIGVTERDSAGSEGTVEKVGIEVQSFGLRKVGAREKERKIIRKIKVTDFPTAESGASHQGGLQQQ